MYKRIFWVVMDSVGIGEAPDAADYGDQGANTLGHIALTAGLSLPTLQKLGLGCIAQLQGVEPEVLPLAAYGKMREISAGKDTVSGHWEMAGCPVLEPFPTFPQGFPEEMVSKLIKKIGCGVLGNIAASGTQIIADLGAEHERTGYPIIYTSADSVLQIAAHEQVIDRQRLYEICRIARSEVCVGRYAVGRVIARPFTGTAGSYERTDGRHDYSLLPPQDTILDLLKNAGFTVTAVGKIHDIFGGRGITRSIPTRSNDEGMTVLQQLAAEQASGMVMVNLVDFDMKYGHRNDAAGYADALEQFDGELARFLLQLEKDDLLIITADHGCDPTTVSTDHSREYVPLLVYYPGCAGVNLGIRSSFADIAAAVAENFSLPPLKYGQSFLGKL